MNNIDEDRLTTTAFNNVIAIAERYELDDRALIAALVEAFQAGIQFATDEYRKAVNG